MRTRKMWMAILILLVMLPVLFLLAAQKTLKRFTGLQPGDAVPEARLRPVGQPWVETSSWHGTPTLLVIFQPGCEACRLEIAGLASIAPSFPDLKIVLLSTRTDLAGMQAPFPIYVDPDGGFLTRVRKLVTPALYWIDASGHVQYARTGQHSVQEEERLLRRLVAGDR